MKTFAVTFLILFSFLSCNNKQQVKQTENAPVNSPVAVEEVKKTEPLSEKDQILKEWEEFKKEFSSYDRMKDREKRKQNTPATLKEAMLLLEKEIRPEDAEMIRNLGDNDGGMFHFGFGMGLRNSWGLWENSRISRHLYSRGIEVGDVASSVIIRSFIKYMQRKEWELEVEKKYPEHFKIVDAVLQNDLESLKKLTADLQVLPEKGTLPSAADVALFSCNASAFTILNRFEKKTGFGGEIFWYCEQNPEFFVEFASQNIDLLKDENFAISILSQSGVLTRICNKVPSFSPETNKNIFRYVLYSGNETDFLCANKKFIEKPEIDLMHFVAKYLSGEKKKFVMSHYKPEIFNNKDKAIQLLSKLKDKEIERIREYFELTEISPFLIEDEFQYFFERKEPVFLDLLFEKGLNPNYFTNYKGPLLNIAIKACNPVFIDHLLEKGADPDFIAGNDCDIPDIIRSGCLINDKNYSELIFKYMIIKGMTVKGREDSAFDDRTIVAYGSIELLKFLHKHEYSFAFNIERYWPLSPLEESIDNRDPEVFTWLINEIGHNINEVDKEGNTLLHRSAKHSELKNVEFLIKKGADLNIKNHLGKAPLDLAKETLLEKGRSCGYSSREVKTAKEIIELLEKSAQKP